MCYWLTEERQLAVIFCFYSTMVMGIPVTSGIEIQSGQFDAGVALETGASYQSTVN